MLTEASGHAESPSLDAKLPLTDSETESDNVASKIDTGDQDEGQAGPNPDDLDESQAGPNPRIQDEGQAGSDLGDAVESQPQSSHVVHAGPNQFTTSAYPNVQENLKLPSKDPMILKERASSTGTLSFLQNLKKELSFTYQFLVEKQHEEDPGKTNAQAEVQSMVSVPIHHGTSLVPLMTTLIINLTTSQSGSPLPTSTATTLTRIDELEQHMANLLQYNLALEERLDKHRSRLYKLKILNIPHQVSKAVDEIVKNADWAMQASLRARFIDLTTVDMKEILQQQICQLDEQWFNLHKDVLKDALDITPTNDSNPYVAPPSSDIVIEYVNTLGYLNTLRNVLAMSVNALYQPWKAILSMINMKNLTIASRGKKKITHFLILNVRFTKLIIHHLKTKHNIHPRTGLPLHYSHYESVLNTLRFVGKDGREIFGMPIPDALLTDEIKRAPYYSEYQEHVAKYHQHLDAEHGKT
nr:hypothetical protein [Tanacetum cinerariifolium]